MEKNNGIKFSTDRNIHSLDLLLSQKPLFICMGKDSDTYFPSFGLRKENDEGGGLLITSTVHKLRKKREKRNSDKSNKTKKNEIPNCKPTKKRLRPLHANLIPNFDLFYYFELKPLSIVM